MADTLTFPPCHNLNNFGIPLRTLIEKSDGHERRSQGVEE